MLVAPLARAAPQYLQVFVAAPYLELHTGPGRGYPVFYVVERNESVDVLKRRTEWFKVRTERGVEGWVAQRDMLQTVLADGTPFRFNFGDRAGFASHRLEVGVFPYADYGGASEISAYASYSLVPDLAVEVSVGEFLGTVTNGTLGDIGLAYIFLPEKRFSPFVTLGTGVVYSQPKATLVVPSDLTNQSAYAGAGFRFYLTRRLFVRGEYRNHIVLTKRNENEQVDEWKFGIAFFL
ncbi:MAG TPA: SH3 domain-containing protein [Steroidobacteraceae bacterium]|nr:SH3 domain-containing protein [Steroidobacteraceae bacterium]